MAIYPADDYRERLYSIGLINNEVNLSVKLHVPGLGSEYLASQRIGQIFNAKVIKNPHFYFPKKSSAVVLISNGTGIAPFLGMIDGNTAKIQCRLYCGFKNSTTLNLFNQQLNGCLESGKLSKLDVALSREGTCQYVSALIEKDASLMYKTLTEGGTIMICGSLSMQRDVFNVLENIVLKTDYNDLAFYQARKQIRSDCY